VKGRQAVRLVNVVENLCERIRAQLVEEVRVELEKALQAQRKRADFKKRGKR
jgi:hypothetical protein